METKVVVKRDAFKQVTLNVIPSDDKITIEAGEFRVGEDHYKIEEYVYTHKINSSFLVVFFYLMKRKETGEVVVVVDEFCPGELPFDMMTDPEYDYLFQIATLRVSENAKDLKDAKMLTIQSDTETKPVDGGGRGDA